MISLYWLDCTPLYDPKELQNALPYLDQERLEKTLRLQTAERRAQSAAAGLLLRHLFGDAALVYGEHGKPYAKDNNRYFSLSHSDRYVVCAVADEEIGVDMEPISPIRPAVLRHCFTQDEQRWIGDDSERFTRLWTMKEAYMKLTGTGMSVPAKEIQLPIPAIEGYDEISRCNWIFPQFPFVTSICTNSSAHLEMIEKTIKDLL